MKYEFSAPLWVWSGKGAWYFLTLPGDISAEIKEIYGASSGGFGSIKVEVSIGSTSWRTSIFRDNKAASYLLPVKKDVRVAENLHEQHIAKVALVVRDVA